jgi:hypothetical protein
MTTFVKIIKKDYDHICKNHKERIINEINMGKCS